MITYVVLSCEQYLNRYTSQRETWLKNQKYIRISSQNNEELNTVGWNTDDSYEGLSLKYLHFFQNVNLDSEWVMFVDDDTFVYTDRIENYLQAYNPDERLYIGFHFNEGAAMSSGAGVILSKTLYQEVCQYVRNTSVTITHASWAGITLFEWVSKIENVQQISDDRFHLNIEKYEEDKNSAFTFHCVTPEKMVEYDQNKNAV